MALLVERESTLGAFETRHFEGHWDTAGTQMTQAIRAAVGNPNIAVRHFPWPLVTLLQVSSRPSRSHPWKRLSEPR
ncbi:MAG: hypothetical protein ACJ8R9_25815 [Steroidobacteraceae bacterium]